MTTRTPDELTEDLVIALSWAEPSRWQIGALMLDLRSTAGEEAMWQAIPEGSERLARVCLDVVARWGARPAPGLEFGHYRRVRWMDDAGAAEWLAEAMNGGWTPAMLGRAMAGFDPDEPTVAAMAQRLADDAGGRLTYEAAAGEWRIEGQAAWQPSMGAAVRACWRAQFGAKGSEGE